MDTLRITFLVAALSGLLVAVDCTIVAVLKLGTGSVVHCTTYSSPTTSVDGVHSFWKTMHKFDNDKISRRHATSLQYHSMGVVSDLINSADGGIAVGIVLNSVDLASMPTISNALKENGAVGHCHVEGKHAENMMKKINSQIVESASFQDSIINTSNLLLVNDMNKLESILVKVDDNEAAANIDNVFTRGLKMIEEQALDVGKTIVIYIVVDESDITPRHLISRDLSEDNNDEDGEDKNEEEEEDQDNEENQNNEENNQGQNVQGQNSYGYFNAYGEWVTTYKTMSQIQHSNVVLWTSVILIVSLIVSTGMMIYMPLMPDTLLFGESAKMVAE